MNSDKLGGDWFSKKTTSMVVKILALGLFHAHSLKYLSREAVITQQRNGKQTGKNNEGAREKKPIFQ